VIEKTIGRPFAKPIWSEMKENAALAFAPRHGGELLLDAIQALVSTWGPQLELHLVGHSAGSIILGHMLGSMAERASIKTALSSVNLYAPACTVSFACRHYANDENVMKRLHLDVLSDKEERDDNVASIYRKSLLYLVSNALETDLRTPILGLERVNDPSYEGWDGSSDTGEALATWRVAAKSVGLSARTTAVTSDLIRVATDSSGSDVTQRSAHGGFDNDIDVGVGRHRRGVLVPPHRRQIDAAVVPPIAGRDSGDDDGKQEDEFVSEASSALKGANNLTVPIGSVDATGYFCGQEVGKPTGLLKNHFGPARSDAALALIVKALTAK